MNKTVLDELLSTHPVTCQVQPVTITGDELVHVVGAQEPVRDQPDERARLLLHAGWLKIETIRDGLTASERSSLVSELQQAARSWLKQSGGSASAADRDQIRWMIEKTRSRESKLQIAQRVWLAAVLYGMNYRGLAFNADGQVLWDEGLTGRIGLSPDVIIDLARSQASRQAYTASFRDPDGTIMRGKGRHRWHIYRLTIDPAADALFERRSTPVHQSVALIMASETYATQPQLPRDFYGGDVFQQACIDAQDQGFDHILVLSPEHGILSLDDTVPSDKSWDAVLEWRIWAWQHRAVQRLGSYLFGKTDLPASNTAELSWWPWLNPESTYAFTIFGGGFIVPILIDHLLQAKGHAPDRWPHIILTEQRPGYDVGDLDVDVDLDAMFGEDDADEGDLGEALRDLDLMLEWATELVSLVNVFVPPTGETWELAPDEAVFPVRILMDAGMDMEDLLDLLTDISLLLEQRLPITLLINASVVVSFLLQITHGLVHNERDAIHELMDIFAEGIIRQYVEHLLQEPSQEDRLCACLTLAEQMQLLAMTVAPPISSQLLIWFQTYVSTRMRPRILGNSREE